MSDLRTRTKEEILSLAARLNEGLAQVEREIAENSAPPMRLVPVPFIGKLVPYNELPEVGIGAIMKAVIDDEIEEHGYSEGVSFSFSPLATRACANCSRVRKVWDLDDDGWCWEGKC